MSPVCGQEPYSPNNGSWTRMGPVLMRAQTHSGREASTKGAATGFSNRSPVLPGRLIHIPGHHRETDRIRALVLEPSPWMETITGPGNRGTTRLAVHIATTLIETLDEDIMFVPLAWIKDPALVLSTTGQVLANTRHIRKNSALRSRIRLTALSSMCTHIPASSNGFDSLKRISSIFPGNEQGRHLNVFLSIRQSDSVEDKSTVKRFHRGASSQCDWPSET